MFQQRSKNCFQSKALECVLIISENGNKINKSSTGQNPYKNHKQVFAEGPLLMNCNMFLLFWPPVSVRYMDSISKVSIAAV